MGDAYRNARSDMHLVRARARNSHHLPRVFVSACTKFFDYALFQRVPNYCITPSVRRPCVMPYLYRRSATGVKRVYNNGVLVSDDGVAPPHVSQPRWRPPVAAVPPQDAAADAAVRMADAHERALLDVRAFETRPAKGPWVLPHSLSVAGNSQAWRQLADMLRAMDENVAPVVVHGPIGCGKTFGVELVCSGLALRRFVVDAAMMHQEVLDVFDHLCGASCFGQRAVLCVEDADGMPPDMPTWIDQGMSRFPNLLVVVTACNRYSPRLSKWRGWRNVRLYRPRAYDVEKLVRSLHPHVSRPTAATLATDCAGDIRRCLMAVQWQMGVAAIDAQHTIFEGAQALFARKQSPQAYAAEFADVKSISTELAFRNYIDVGQQQMTVDHAAAVADMFSVANSAACDATWVALCAHLQGVLPAKGKCPPLYLAKTAAATRPSQSKSIDYPALLGGCALSCSNHQSQS